MSKKLKIFIASLSVATILFVVAGLKVQASSSNDEGAYRQLGVYSEVLSRIRSEYVEEPNFALVTDGALHGLLDSLDASSSYLSPAEYKRFRERKTADMNANIGATVSKRFGYAAVVSVVPNGPADRANIETGDIIESLEGRSTREMSLAEIRAVLAGAKGSQVNFAVVRPRRAEPQKLTIQRDFITPPGTTDKMLESNIGYIKPGALSKGKAQEIAAKIKQMQGSGAKKLVLDLRSNSEGDENEGVEVANLFLDRGMISYISGQKYKREDFNADPKKHMTKMPLVVLVNRGTAGPAEIVAAAVLENGRGDVVGDKTFGMGSVQKLIEIQDGSALMLSIAKYYTPNGKAIQDSAITPNIMVPDVEDLDSASSEDDGGNENATAEQQQEAAEKKATQQRSDEQLQRAVAVLKNKNS